MLSEKQIYAAFRSLLLKHLRISDQNSIHVSEAVGCLRKAWLNRKYGDLRNLNHLSNMKCVVLGLGLASHFVLEQALRELGYVVEKPVTVEFPNGLKLIGTPDGFNSQVVIEIIQVTVEVGVLH